VDIFRVVVIDGILGFFLAGSVAIAFAVDCFAWIAFLPVFAIVCWPAARCAAAFIFADVGEGAAARAGAGVINVTAAGMAFVVVVIILCQDGRGRQKKA